MTDRADQNAVLRDVLLEHGLSEAEITRMLLVRHSAGHIYAQATETVREKPVFSRPKPYDQWVKEDGPLPSVVMVKDYDYALGVLRSPEKLDNKRMMVFYFKEE
jgi:hypothetical protein